jgi:uncharacterized protein GlcG (DUF336 family)
MATTENAHRVIAAGEAKAKAKEIGQPMNIAVADAGANLKAFIRMNGAWPANRLATLGRQTLPPLDGFRRRRICGLARCAEW